MAWCASDCTYSLRARVRSDQPTRSQSRKCAVTRSFADLSRRLVPEKRVWGRKCQAAAVRVDIAESARALFPTSLRVSARAEGLRVVAEAAGCVRERRRSDARLDVADGRRREVEAAHP